MRVLVTGGCGFIGSNFIKYILGGDVEKDTEVVVNLDKQTYAGQGKNLEHMGVASDPRYFFVKGDICDKKLVEQVFQEYKPDLVFHFAAESHVDRSIDKSDPFSETNMGGTQTLLDAAKTHGVKRFIQIGTDEVYGSLSGNDASSTEKDLLKPRSPYSASKAAADLLALSYYHTHQLPVIVTRSSNNYGPYQFPEKLLPLFITNLIQGKKVPLMWNDENPGLNVRDWLHVEDNCRAIWLVSRKGEVGEIYNIAGDNERTNIHMTNLLLDYFGVGEEMIEKIPHRLGHDFRYSINDSKLKALGFQQKHPRVEDAIRQLCKWHEENKDWWAPLKK